MEISCNDENKIMFSVVIPLYNKRAYIKDAIKSVIDGEFDKFEIIVIDDGSTDDGYKVVNEIQDERIRLIRTVNSGVSAARNIGISNSKGEWITFLDADDWVHPLYLVHQNETISKYSNFDIVATRFFPIPDAEDWAPVPWLIGTATYEVITDLPKRWMHGIPFFTGSIAVRRSLLEKTVPCFQVGDSVGEDLDLWFRLAEHTSIILLKSRLVAYRTHVRGSLSMVQNYTLIAPYMNRMAERVRKYPKNDQRRISALWFIAQIYISESRVLLSRGQRYLSIKNLIKCRGEGFLLRRWWITLFMTFTMPKEIVSRIQKSRDDRQYRGDE
jgi:glycosyltransferase involved in cell wall biosynthesis